jgi:hypothetical protein
MARQNLQQDPREWGGAGLQPDLLLLAEVLAGLRTPNPDNRLILDLTIEQVGLPPLGGLADEEALSRWRSRALARLLVTQAHQAAPDLIPEGHELLIPADRRKLALQLLDRCTDSLRLRQRLPDAILEADCIADLGSQVGGATVEHGPFLSHAAEGALFRQTCSQLAQQTGKTLLQSIAAIEDDLARHARGFWGTPPPLETTTRGQGDKGSLGTTESLQAKSLPVTPSPPLLVSGKEGVIPWAELLRLSQAAGALLEASPASDWATPDEAIAWYTAGGWRVDRAGEELTRNLDHPTPELLPLITPLRAAYRARWEHLMIQWSQVWTDAGCPVPETGTAGGWLKEQLENKRPTAVLIVDALRYDLGAVLADLLNQREGTERATLHAARAPLPSITPLGMGAALPIPEDDLQAELVDGKWQLQHKANGENLSPADRRRAWWQAHGAVPEDGLLTISDVVGGDVPAPEQHRARLVIYDRTIDRLGHDDELESQGSGVALDRYLTAVERLRDAGWLRILVVTDHGYIHWTGTDERDAKPPAPDPVYTSRRALAYPAHVTIEGPQALAPGGKWRIAVPRGAASFRAYGGLGYFHGGASHQEWIVPCLRIEWPLQARPLEAELAPLEHVLSQRPRVTLHVVRSSLFVEDVIPRQVEVIIRHAAQRTILFRSEPITLTPDQQTIDVRLRASPGVVAGRGTPLRIEVRDTRTEEVLDTVDSTLLIEMTWW